MEPGSFVIVEPRKKTSISQWTENFVNDVNLHSSVLVANVALRQLGTLENIVAGTFSGRASVHSYKIENFGLSLVNNANNVYTYTIPQAKLTIENAILAHASGQNTWVVPTWKDPKFVLLSEYLTPIWVRLKEIMKLPSNWDSFDAEPISPQTVAKTIELLIEVFEMEYRLGYERIIPFVAPCSDGSVQIEWEVGKKELEVVIPSSENEKISLLQVSGEGKEFKESTINSPEEISEYLSWLLIE